MIFIYCDFEWIVYGQIDSLGHGNGVWLAVPLLRVPVYPGLVRAGGITGVLQ